MLTATKIFQFSAAHHLPDYEGLCKNVHGHTWKLEVTVEGDVIIKGPKRGMVMDFKDLKAYVNRVIIDSHDHANLNHIYDNPTAENMVREIFRKLVREIEGQAKLVRGIEGQAIRVVKVRLWESDTAYVEYSKK